MEQCQCNNEICIATDTRCRAIYVLFIYLVKTVLNVLQDITLEILENVNMYFCVKLLLYSLL